MITLTTPANINSVLGGNAPVPYNKLVVGPFVMDGIGQTISGTLRLTSTTAPTMQAILGTLRMSVPLAELIVEVPQLDFIRRVQTSSPQNTSIIAWIEAAQKQIEDGLISVGVIAGTRAVGV